MFTRAAWAQLAATSATTATHRLFSTTRCRYADFTHAVIGGGVVGLATARGLARRGGSVLLLERHGAVGTETSSRNSEVIHAGLYYGRDSLKTALCIRGRHLLYALARRLGVPHRNTGKWIVAQDAAQLAALGRLHDACARELHVPVRWVGAAEAARREPEVRADAGVLESPATGIVDSHALMLALLAGLEDAGGTVALRSAVRAVAPLPGAGAGAAGLPGSGGWEIRVADGGGRESTVTAETLVNSAGLGAVDVHNMIVPAGARLRAFYAKGNYFSYGAARPRVGTLVYPAPEPGLGGLGTHLTLDMGGRIRFGPDVQWVESAGDLAVDSSRLPQAVAEIRRFLPSIDEAALAPDYAGIRPKLGRASAVAQGKGFQDFIIRKEQGYEGWVNLLGIESPGLTSSLAIAEMVEGLFYS